MTLTYNLIGIELFGSTNTGKRKKSLGVFRKRFAYHISFLLSEIV